MDQTNPGFPRSRPSELWFVSVSDAPPTLSYRREDHYLTPAKAGPSTRVRLYYLSGWLGYSAVDRALKETLRRR